MGRRATEIYEPRLRAITICSRFIGGLEPFRGINPRLLAAIDLKILDSAFSAASGVSSNCARTIAPSTAKAMASVSCLRHRSVSASYI
jgi:hypothetical protein